MSRIATLVLLAGSLSLGLVGTSARAADAPTDAEIAQIVVTANSVDIAAGEAAKKKSKNKEVKEFAQRMITDHTAVNKQATELVTKLGVTPKESETSKSLQADGDKMKAKLGKMKGKAFDKAYVDNEVTYHETVLGAIDNTLIPNAQNAELKSLLEKTRPAIAAHLDHAKKIQSEMGGKK